jgi:hypothetical protein
LAASGTIAGVEVSGYLHQDHAYGPAGKVYPELPIARRLQGRWVSWLHTYEEGEWGGGSFWQGRDGLAFELDTPGSYIHYFGRLNDSSFKSKPTRSWCWVEYAGGMLTPEILDLVMHPFRLARGR